MAKLKYGSNATFVSPNKGLSLIGDHAYAFSGIIADASSGAANSVMLSFQTGQWYFVGHLNFTDDVVANDNVFLAVTFNGQTVINLDYKGGAAGSDNLNPYDLLIPPLTEVVVKWGSSSADEGTAWLVGKIYR